MQHSYYSASCLVPVPFSRTRNSNTPVIERALSFEAAARSRISKVDFGAFIIWLQPIGWPRIPLENVQTQGAAMARVTSYDLVRRVDTGDNREPTLISQDQIPASYIVKAKSYNV